jgi:hypothetical protein
MAVLEVPVTRAVNLLLPGPQCGGSGEMDPHGRGTIDTRNVLEAAPSARFTTTDVAGRETACPRADNRLADTKVVERAEPLSQTTSPFRNSAQPRSR